MRGSRWRRRCGTSRATSGRATCSDFRCSRSASCTQQRGGPVRSVAQAADEALTIEQPFTPAIKERAAGKKGDTLETAKPANPPRAAERANWVATTPGTAAAPPVAPEIARTARGRLVANGPEPSEPPAASAAEAEPSSTPPPSMSQYTSTKKLAIPDPAGGFNIGPAEVLIHVRGDMLTRLDGLVASWGSVTMKPELKRFRGKATDKPFGDGSRRMLRATGEGRYV